MNGQPQTAPMMPLPPVDGARLADAALIGYGRAFEHPCKIRIVRWLVRHMVSGRINVRHAGGLVVAIDPQDYIGWAIFKTGVYEPASLALAMRIMTAEPGLFVDVGANFGWYTCAIASVAGSMVVSVEPDPENCASLRANVTRNRLDNVTVFNGAAGPDLSLLSLARRSCGNSGTVAVISDGRGNGAGRYWVAATPLGVLLQKLVHPPARPVLLKLDVEGFESEVLAGLDFDGPFRPKNILLEYEQTFSAETWGSDQGFATFFTQRNYDLFDVTGIPFVPDRPLPEANVWARDRNPAP